MITETNDIIAVVILVILASVGLQHILQSIWDKVCRHGGGKTMIEEEDDDEDEDWEDDDEESS